MRKLDGLVFTGGADISPTFYKTPEPWHGIEAVERTDKPFFIGLQYHPEVAVAKHANGAADASRFMDYDSVLCYFRALTKQGVQKH